MWHEANHSESDTESPAGADALDGLRGELLSALDRLVARALARAGDARMREGQGEALARAGLGLDLLARELIAERALLGSERDGRIVLSLIVETEHALAEVGRSAGGERAAALAAQLGVATRTAFHPCVGFDWSGTGHTR